MSQNVLQVSAISTDTTSGTSTPRTFASNVTAGSVLVAFVTWSTAINAGATPSVSDNINGSWTQVGSTLTDTNATQSLAAFLVPNAGAGATTVTFTLSAANRYRGILIVEIDGSALSSVLDGTNGSVQSPGPNTTDGLTSGNFATTAANTMLLGCSLDNFIGSPTQGTGFTSDGAFWDFNNGGGGATYARLEHKTVTSSGTYATTFTGATGNGTMTIGLALKEAGASSAPTPLVGFDSPPPPRATKRLPVPWEPLPAVVATAALTAVAFSGSPVPRKLHPLRPVDWQPLPAIAAASVSWGFSGGNTTVNVQPPPIAWEPLPALPATLVPGGLSISPVPPRLRRPVVEGWEPLPNGRPAVLDVQGQGTLPPALRRARVADWEPLPATRPAVVDAQDQGPAPRPPRRPFVDAWTPLAPLVAVSASLGPECSSPVPSRLRAAAVAAWEPLASLPISGSDLQAATPARRRGVMVDSWSVLPSAIVPPAVPQVVETTPPVPAKRRSPWVDPWEPLGAIAVPPAAVPGIDCASPLPVRMVRARVDGWEPLAGVGAPAVFSSDAVGARQRRVAPEQWEPLPALPVAAVLGFVFSDAPAGAKARRPAEQPWSVLVAAAPAAPIAYPFADGVLPAHQRRPLAGDWEVLPALPATVPSFVFSDSPVTHVRPVRVDAWDPLPDMIPLPPTIPWAEAGPPIVRLRRAQVLDWEPLGAVVIRPLPPRPHGLPVPRVEWQNVSKRTEERLLVSVPHWGLPYGAQIIASYWNVAPTTSETLEVGYMSFGPYETSAVVSGGVSRQLYRVENSVAVLLSNGSTRALTSTVWVWVSDER